MSTTSVYCNECDSGGMNSYYLLLIGIIPAIISAIISAIVTAVILRLFSELKCRSKKKISFSNNSSHFPERSIQNAPGPLYEEVDLTNKDFTLNFSQNVAYQYTSN